jgi:uncharacterized protein (TIGR03435 family)
MRLTRAAGVLLALAVLVRPSVLAQTPAPKLEFEVASVRPSSKSVGDTAPVALGLRLDGSQARIGALTLRDYIAMAYRIKSYQVMGADWVSTDRFDVNAKLPEGSSVDQIPAMLQSLLSERFGLKFHREPREQPVYMLLVGKPPLKLKDSPVDPDAPAPTAAVNISATGSAAGVSVNLGNGSSYTFAGGKFEGKKIAGRVLADVLERYTDRPVIDATGLNGTYDFSFTVTPEDYQTLLIRAAVNSGVFLPPQILRLLDNGGDPLGDALSQLGLKLESRKAPVDLLIVDQILRTPTDN